jgi:hypothetical protein
VTLKTVLFVSASLGIAAFATCWSVLPQTQDLITTLNPRYDGLLSGLGGCSSIWNMEIPLAGFMASVGLAACPPVPVLTLLDRMGVRTRQPKRMHLKASADLPPPIPLVYTKYLS